jgi:hypothetical protein
VPLPEITDDELVMYHVEDWKDLALEVYLERTQLDRSTLDWKVLTEMFDWEWWNRLYGGQDP